jgi:hypothetical protein
MTVNKFKIYFDLISYYGEIKLPFGNGELISSH